MAILTVCTVIVVFCLSLMVAGLFGWNCYLLMKNETSMENYENEVTAAKKKQPVRQLVAPPCCPACIECSRMPQPIDLPLQVKHPYNLGCVRNIKSVMGPYPFLWLLPMPPVGNLYHYERHRDFEDEEMQPLDHSV